MLEGYRSGWPPGLSPEQKEQLGDILDSGPVAYGLDTGIWTSPMIAWIIEQEFGVQYHPGHVRKLLHELQFSVQRPHRVLTRANPTEQDRWHRYTYPRLKKNPKRKTGRLFLPMKPASVRIPRSTPPGVESGIPRKFPLLDNVRASRFWAPSSCGRCAFIISGTPYSMRKPTWPFCRP